MKRDETVYLQHIVDAIARLEGYLAGVDEEMFYERRCNGEGLGSGHGEVAATVVREAAR